MKINGFDQNKKHHIQTFHYPISDNGINFQL